MGNILQDIDRPVEARKYFIQAEEVATRLAAPSPAMQHSISAKTALSALDIWNFTVGTSKVIKLDSDNHVEMKCVSSRPLILTISNFLSETECEHIITRAQDSASMRQSQIMGGSASLEIDASIEAVNDNLYQRSSTNAWLPFDDILRTIQQRISIVTNISDAYIRLKCEELQVVRYESGQDFKLHHDSSLFHSRLFTTLIYLNNVSDPNGGETWFPFGCNHKQSYDHESISSVDGALALARSIKYQEHSDDYGASGLYIKPIRGTSVIFFNHLQSGEIDPLAVHSGEAIIHGLKWAANYWVDLDLSLLEQFKVK